MCDLLTKKNMKTKLFAVFLVSILVMFSLFSIIKFATEVGDPHIEPSGLEEKDTYKPHPNAVFDKHAVVRLTNLEIESLQDNHSYNSSLRYPYIAAIIGRNGGNSKESWRFSCFGCVILPSWIVSAAHCQKPDHTYRALLFYDYIRNHTWTYPVEQWTVHPGYDPNRTVPWHDIALAKLGVILPSMAHRPAELTKDGMVHASIWKTLTTMDRKIYLSNDMDIYDGAITDPSTCYELYGFSLDETLICVDMLHSDCFVNEFGPIYTSSQRVLGVLRLKPTDCDVKQVIFTNVSSYIDWIEKATAVGKGKLVL